MSKVFIDYDNLRSRLFFLGYDMKYLADTLDMNYSTFLKRIDNQVYFNAAQIVLLSKALKIEHYEIPKYFFTEKEVK